MNRCSGFTLVEILVVICIFGSLMALGAPAFNKWQKKHAVEGQIEKLYSDLQFARMTAYAEKAASGLWWSKKESFSSYEVRSDNSTSPDGDITDTNRDVTHYTVTLKFPANANTVNVTFDTKGLPLLGATLSISPNYGASIDCISVSMARIRIGKWGDKDDDCIPK